MRIIGGKARGTKLHTLEGKNTRPTLDRVKESLFNIIQMDILESDFLDVFAGSGAIGLEAASRGANRVVLSDSSKKACEIINLNINKVHFEDKVEVFNSCSDKMLKLLEKQKFNLIYIDPPYENINLIKETIELILKYNLLDQDHIIIIETDNEENVLKKINTMDINIIDKRKYGRVSLIFLTKKD